MNNPEIIILAIILAVDAFAVSIACGLSKKEIHIFQILKVGLFFGIAQAIMPLLGFFTWDILPFNIVKYEKWIAFSILTIIGIHMVKESFDPEVNTCRDLFTTKALFLAAIATSIDALAAGISLALLNSEIMLLTITTGLITATASILGVFIGKKYGHIIENKMEIISGIILVLIGIKQLF